MNAMPPRSRAATPAQGRTQRTRARLISTAEALVRSKGFAGLRVEQVVKGAGVAKGTFFAHFPDKDALLERLIGQRLLATLERLDPARRPESPEALVEALTPFLRCAGSEPLVHDLVLRRLAAPSAEDPGLIAQAFAGLESRLAAWFGGFFGAPPFRTDLDAMVMAEGVRALMMQVMALRHCALHAGPSPEERLKTYIEAFLMPPGGQ